MKKHTLYVCNSCRFNADSRFNEHELSGGVLLYDALRRAIRNRPDLKDSIDLKEFNCLMSCDEHCNVHLRHPDKISYILGRWQPDDESAEAILDYAEQYLISDSGQVPFRSWPQTVKGHFIARIPPLSE